MAVRINLSNGRYYDLANADVAGTIAAVNALAEDDLYQVALDNGESVGINTAHITDVVGLAAGSLPDREEPNLARR